MNKIALFTVTPRSLTALLIAAVTRCPFSHAAICVNGTWWHASEKHGGFSKMQTADYLERHCTVLSFDGDLNEWVKSMDGKAYDWHGIAGWVKRVLGMKYNADDHKFYCFEAALAGLITARQHFLGRHPRNLKQLDEDILTLLNDAMKQAAITPIEKAMISGRGIGKRKIMTENVVEIITRNPITGCDIAKLFPLSRTGKFGTLL